MVGGVTVYLNFIYLYPYLVCSTVPLFTSVFYFAIWNVMAATTETVKGCPVSAPAAERIMGPTNSDQGMKRWKSCYTVPNDHTRICRR